MRAFARLLDCLVYTQSRNRKVALLGHYFRTAPDPDRGWALAALTDGVPIRLPLRRMLGDLVTRFIDPVLYRLSRDYVGDTAETVSLLWPDNGAVVPRKQIDTVIQSEEQLEKTSCKASQLPLDLAPRAEILESSREVAIGYNSGEPVELSLGAVVEAMADGTTAERTERL